jgi:precorrin-6x reductase
VGIIDEQKENIDAARALGFNTILVENSNGQPNIQAVREQLKNITPFALEEDAIYA